MRMPSWIMPVLIGLVLAGCAGPRVNGPAAVGAANDDGDRTRYQIREEVRMGADLRREFERALALLESGEYAQGIELMSQLTEHPLVRENTAPFIDLAIAYQKTGRLAEAEASLERALAINPAHPVANNEYGLVMRRSGRFAEARRAYETALDRYPEFLPARRNLGILCDLYLGDYACALENYRIYVEAVTDDPAIGIWIADLEQRIAQDGPSR